MSEILKYRLIFFLKAIGDSFLVSFYALYLLSIGISGARLGLALAVFPLVAILFNPLWAYVAKNPIITKRLVHWMPLVEALAVVVFILAPSYEAILVGLFLIGIFSSPYISLQDSIVVNYCNRNGKDYASVRIFASLSYMIATATGGLIATFIHYHILFILSVSLFLSVFVLWFFVKPIEYSEGDDLERGNIRELFANKAFLKYGAIFVMGVGAMMVGENFFSAYLESRNIGAIPYGFITSLVIFVEIIMIQIVVRTRKIKYNYKLLFVLGYGAIVLRNLIYALDPPIEILIIGATLKGFGWGTIASIHVNYIAKIVKAKNVTFALIFVSSIYSGTVAIMNTVSGEIYDRFGFALLYLVVTGLSLIAFVLTLTIKKMHLAVSLDG